MIAVKPPNRTPDSPVVSLSEHPDKPQSARFRRVEANGFRAYQQDPTEHLNVPVVSISPEDAGAHFGFLGMVLAVDQPASSALTRALLGWQPTQPGLIADFDQGHYVA